MPRFGLIGLLLLSSCMGRTEFGSSGLEQAERNFPPMIIGANTHAVYNGVALRSCPASGSIVEQKGGPSLRYLGASPTTPDLCRVQMGNDTVEGWYGLWLTIWPGAEAAYPALTRLIRGSTGRVEGFDVFMVPGYHYHDLIRNEGVEEVSLLGTTYRALKLAHYRRDSTVTHTAPFSRSGKTWPGACQYTPRISTFPGPPKSTICLFQRGSPRPSDRSERGCGQPRPVPT